MRRLWDWAGAMAKPDYDHQWRKLVEQVLERDGHRCQLRLRGCRGVAVGGDHIVPLADGGPRLDPRNVRATCRSCNTARENSLRAAARRAQTSERSYPGPSREW